MKRVLYIKSPNPAWMDIAGYLQENHDFDPVLWVSSVDTDHEACKARFPNTDIFCHYKAQRAEMPETVAPGSRCVDSTFLTNNAHHENIFYNMIDRWAGDPSKISMEKRRFYYIDMANAWFSIYESLNIDVVLTPTVPHRLYDYMAYIVAQEMGIPFIMLDESNEVLIDAEGTRKTLFYFLDTIFDRSRTIREHIQDDRKPSEDLQHYIDNTLRDYSDVQPEHFKKKNEQPEPLKLRLQKWFWAYVPALIRLPLHAAAALYKNGSLYTTKLAFPYRTKPGAPVRNQNVMECVFWQTKVRKRVNKAKAWYEAHTTQPDLSKKYVYFAPNFQPERTSTPDAGLCQWSELMIEMIAASIPKDWKIYLKEHPSNYRAPIMPDNNRSIGLYERFQHLAPNIEFMPLDHDPLELIDHAQCVATATGTSAWQAVTRGVPAMIFGENWFTSCPEIAHIQSIEECQSFIKDIQAGRKVNRDSVIQYLCALEHVGGSYDWARGYRPYEPEKLEAEIQKATVKDFCEDIYAMYSAATKTTKKKKAA